MSSDAPPPPPPPPPAASSAAPAAEAAPRAPAPLPLLAVKTVVDPLVTFHNYLSEEQLAAVMELVDRDLSEPYSIFTYRYFLNEWPNLCLIAKAPTEAGGEGTKEKETIGVIICKAEREKCERFGGDVYRGYIAMLAVGKGHRKRGIGSELVRRAVERMAGLGCDEIVLEAEVVNNGALSLYEKMGFCRDEHLLRYYLNGNDAYRLKLWINPPPLPAAPAAAVPPVPPPAAATATAAR